MESFGEDQTARATAARKALSVLIEKAEPSYQ